MRSVVPSPTIVILVGLAPLDPPYKKGENA